jgi:hypothetical protein
MIVVAIRCAGGTLFLACLCKERTNLPCRTGSRAVMVVRLLACHFGGQNFEVVDREKEIRSSVGCRRNSLTVSRTDTSISIPAVVTGAFLRHPFMGYALCQFLTSLFVPSGRWHTATDNEIVSFQQ